MSVAKTSITTRRKSTKQNIFKQNEDGHQNAHRSIEVFHDQEFFLRKVFMTDLLIEDTVLSALLDCFSQFETLTVLRLDYCNIPSKTLQSLAEHLKLNNINLKELSLKGNPNYTQNFDCMLTKSLETLSLKLCEIDHIGMEKLAKWFTENCVDTNLVYLDLSSNLIFDENVKYLASILRCHRKLKFLNVADCKITDKGVEELLQVFKKFVLNPEEIYQRRRLRFDYFRALTNENNRNQVQNQINGNKQEHERQKTDDLIEEGPTPSNFKELEEKLKIHPFTDQSNVFPSDRKLWCKGNSTLSYLNLSYNRLTKESFKSVLKTLDTQKQQFGTKRGMHHLILEGTDFQKNSQQEIEEIQQFLTDKLANPVEPDVEILEHVKSDNIAGDIARKIKKMKENRASTGSKRSRSSKQSNK